MTDTNQAQLDCGHTVDRTDHRWVTVDGKSACRQRCAEKIESR